MMDIFWFCLFNWSFGGILLLSSILNWRVSHIRYLSDSKPGEIISRLLTGAFGCVVFLVGLMVFLAPA